jgi:hypothetical protein
VRWNAGKTRTQAISAHRCAADALISPITPAIVPPRALSSIAKRIHEEFCRISSSTDARIWPREESSNGKSRCRSGCALTCAAYSCACSDGMNGVSFTRSDSSVSL